MGESELAGLPPGLAPPVKVTLARAIAGMPRANALPCALVFEPKWDGYIHCTLSTRGPICAETCRHLRLAFVKLMPGSTAALALGPQPYVPAPKHRGCPVYNYSPRLPEGVAGLGSVPVPSFCSSRV